MDWTKRHLRTIYRRREQLQQDTLFVFRVQHREETSVYEGSWIPEFIIQSPSKKTSIATVSSLDIAYGRQGACIERSKQNKCLIVYTELNVFTNFVSGSHDYRLPAPARKTRYQLYGHDESLLEFNSICSTPAFLNPWAGRSKIRVEESRPERKRFRSEKEATRAYQN
jgi:hypothetical protein